MAVGSLSHALSLCLSIYLLCGLYTQDEPKECVGFVLGPRRRERKKEGEREAGREGENERERERKWEKRVRREREKEYSVERVKKTSLFVCMRVNQALILFLSFASHPSLVDDISRRRQRPSCSNQALSLLFSQR